MHAGAENVCTMFHTLNFINNWDKWVLVFLGFLRLGSHCNIVKRSVAKIDPVKCEQEQILRCVAGITSFKNGAK